MADFPREQAYIPRIEHGTAWILCPTWLAKKKSAKLWRATNRELKECNIPLRFYAFPETGRTRKP
jgi:hypothetical protein